MSDLVNIPRKLFDATLAAAAVSVNIKTRDRAEFGKLDNIDGESLLATLVEMVTTLRAAARPGPGGCACLATVTAERDEALKVLRELYEAHDIDERDLEPYKRAAIIDDAKARARLAIAKAEKKERVG